MHLPVVILLLLHQHSFVAAASTLLPSNRPNAPPTEWVQGIKAKDVLFSTADSTYKPVSSNGHLGFTIDDDGIYLSGIYNGNSTDAAPSHRARIPVLFPFVAIPDEQHNNNSNITYTASALDLRKATFSRRGYLANASDHGRVDIEEKYYAHRIYRSILVMELKVTYFPGLADGPKELRLFKKALGPFSGDIEFQDLSSAEQYPGLKVLQGQTRISEGPDVLRPVVTVVATEVPDTLTVNKNESFVFITAVRTSLDPVDLYGDSLNGALNDHRLARSMANSGELLKMHAEGWKNVWIPGIEINGNRNDIALAVNASMYALFSATRADWSYGQGPAGITQAYNGHSFWDTEIWMFPVFLLLDPKLARSLLRYRFDRLQAAMEKAESFGYQGAMYPWESAFSGAEVCPVEAPMGHREQHVSGDVAFAVWEFWKATNDLSWLRDEGFPMLKGIAEFWVSRVEIDQQNQSHVRNVMPPDEYHDHVDDSVYTNVIASMSLGFATQAAGLLEIEADPRWKEIQSSLVILFDEQQGIHPEFLGYNGTTIKQADVVLLGYPLGYKMPADVRKADLGYYGTKADHQRGPAMTWSMHTIGWLDIGEEDLAATYFNRSFLDYVQGPFGVWTEAPNGEGVRNFLTGAGGFLQALIYGYAGFRLQEHALRLAPKCPQGVQDLKFRQIVYLGNRLSLQYHCGDSSDDGKEEDSGSMILKLLRPATPFTAVQVRVSQRDNKGGREKGWRQLFGSLQKRRQQHHNDAEEALHVLVVGKALILPIQEAWVRVVEGEEEGGVLA